MGDIEETVGRALSDVKKLEDQISALLCSLKNSEAIVEADLIPFPPSSGKSAKKKSDVVKNIVEPMEVDDYSRLREIATYRSGFVPLESEIFLVPLLDKWVFGITLTNKSSRPLSPPYLVLTMTSKSPTRINSCSAFSYNVLTSLLGVKENIIPTSRTQLGIPYQDSMGFATDDLQSGKVQMVQAGFNVLLTACFDHPMQFCDDNNEFTLLISICSGGQHLWSRSMNIKYTDLHSLHNEQVLEKHKINILTALSTYHDDFILEKLSKRSSKSYADFNLSTLISRLGFEKIKSENIEDDIVIETMAPPLTSILSGSILKIEKCSAAIANVRCSISTRTADQMQIFCRAYCKVLKERETEEKKPTVKVISSNAKTISDFSNALHYEVSHLLKLIHLNHKGLSSEPSSKKDLEWMKEYYKCLVGTDSVMSNIL